MDQYPVRSPLAVADFLAPTVAGRNFCEIGTRNGDIMACLSHFASNVTAIEMDHVYCKKLEERGYRIICKPIEQVKTPELAHCEVYFWWPMDPRDQNEVWLRQILASHRKLDTPAEIYVAHDTHWKFDMETLPKLVANHKSSFGGITRVFFDEGGELTGNTSYTHPFFSRPGHWGVFHLARFDAIRGRGSGRGRGRGRGRGKLLGRGGGRGRWSAGQTLPLETGA